MNEKFWQETLNEMLDECFENNDGRAYRWSQMFYGCISATLYSDGEFAISTEIEEFKEFLLRYAQENGWRVYHPSKYFTEIVCNI